MIHITNSVVLAAGTEYLLGLDTPIIGYENFVTAAGIAVESADPLFPGVNLATMNTEQWWKSVSTAEQTISVTISPSKPIEVIGFIRHNFGSGEISVFAEYEDPDNPGVFLPLNAGQIQADDRMFVLWFAPVWTNVVKITLTPQGAVAPRCGVLWVGPLLKIPRGIPPGFTPITMGRQTEMKTKLSQSGGFLGQTIEHSALKTQVPFNLLDPEWFRAEMEPFLLAQDVGFALATRADPFIFGWAPQSYPNETAFCWFEQSPIPTINEVSGYFSVTLSLGGLAA